MRGELVEMRHPDLDTTIRVTEKAVPVHERSGWRRIEEESRAEEPLLGGAESEEEE